MKAIKLSRLGSLNHLWVVFQVQSTEETEIVYIFQLNLLQFSEWLAVYLRSGIITSVFCC